MIESYNNKNHSNKIISNKAVRSIWNKSRDYVNKNPDAKLVEEIYKLCLMNGMDRVK